jgi:hypothetical protein
VIFAAGIKSYAARRANISAFLVFTDRQSPATGAAEHSERVKFISRPDLSGVSFVFIMTLATGKPSAAAFKSDRNNIERTAVVFASRLIIEQNTVDLEAVDQLHRTRAVMVISLVFGG